MLFQVRHRYPECGLGIAMTILAIPSWDRVKAMLGLLHQYFIKKEMKMIMKKNEWQWRYENKEYHSLLWTPPTDSWCTMLETCLRYGENIVDKKLSVESWKYTVHSINRNKYYDCSNVTSAIANSLFPVVNKMVHSLQLRIRDSI